ncbi:chromodomain protein Chp1 [Schizosaccharomyces japonicus yFS275]|uniref:Chromodomain protein Chp1 n=1 Tax=Schizosaccharomyces japonicus (strain yFS275 / FY16936) TaxID=402676 RepID=B6K5E2_SCHJY|nr:chromodomain protein Chp1 [Schizosaccharomyces japonicus yFS275]EEB08746.1 chromodomain protein Chp1 [Schizosaccharomyces japonicus yFS275]
MDSSDDEYDSDVYEVEHILDEKTDENGNTLYYIKWAGYEWYDNTWEPEANLVGADLALKDWKKRKELISRNLIKPYDSEGNERRKEERELEEQKKEKERRRLRLLVQAEREKSKRQTKRSTAVTSRQSTKRKKAAAAAAASPTSTKKTRTKKTASSKSTTTTSTKKKRIIIDDEDEEDGEDGEEEAIAVPRKSHRAKAKPETINVPDSDNSDNEELPSFQKNDKRSAADTSMESGNSSISSELPPLLDTDMLDVTETLFRPQTAKTRSAKPAKVKPIPPRKKTKAKQTLVQDESSVADGKAPDAASLFVDGLTNLSQIKFKKHEPASVSRTVVITGFPMETSESDFREYFAFITKDMSVSLSSPLSKQASKNVAYVKFDTADHALLACEKGHPQWRVAPSQDSLYERSLAGNDTVPEEEELVQPRSTHKSILKTAATKSSRLPKERLSVSFSEAPLKKNEDSKKEEEEEISTVEKTKSVDFDDSPLSLFDTKKSSSDEHLETGSKDAKDKTKTSKSPDKDKPKSPKSSEKEKPKSSKSTDKETDGKNKKSKKTSAKKSSRKKPIKPMIVGSSWTAVNSSQGLGATDSESKPDDSEPDSVVPPVAPLSDDENDDLEHLFSEDVSSPASSAKVVHIPDYWRFVLRSGKSLSFTGELELDLSKLKEEEENKPILQSLITKRQIDVVRFISTSHLELFGDCVKDIMQGNLYVRNDVDMNHFRNILVRSKGAGIVLEKEFSLLFFTSDNEPLMNMYKCSSGIKSPFWIVLLEPFAPMLRNWASKNSRATRIYNKSFPYLTYLLQLSNMDYVRAGAFQPGKVIVYADDGPETLEVVDMLRSAKVQFVMKKELNEKSMSSVNLILVHTSLKTNINELPFLTLAKRQVCRFYLFGVDTISKKRVSRPSLELGAPESVGKRVLHEYVQRLLPIFPRGGILSVTPIAFIKKPDIIKSVLPFIQLKITSWRFVLPVGYITMLRSCFEKYFPNEPSKKLNDCIATYNRLMEEAGSSTIMMLQDWEVIESEDESETLLNSLLFYQQKHYEQYRRFVLLHDVQKFPLKEPNGIETLTFNDFRQRFMSTVGLG